jgi:hypothetical protein
MQEREHEDERDLAVALARRSAAHRASSTAARSRFSNRESNIHRLARDVQYAVVSRAALARATRSLAVHRAV